ncbi:DUF3987 domain-containing protein [Bifidobacterium pseudolongum]|uniref:DUF3987 domain-containing protein n=1 Tax=Bifidobacterium pseudolongum TaxID=1694 RepID=UPI00117761DE|nr:DUF3987 domain-containing protein [Bifidobacterium pseudolongum]
MTETMNTDPFWDARPWLRWIYDDAKFRRLNPAGLLFAVMARLSALTPPNVVVQVSPHDRPMPLNLNVVLVGGAGTGKGKTLREARELLPTPEGNRLRTLKPKTGEGIITAFVVREERRNEDGKIVKGEYADRVQTDRALIELTEVTDLRTSMAGEGSTMLATLLAAFSGEPLGGNTRSERSNVVLAPNTYRLSSVIAAQPSQADVFFSNADVGFASRFLFASAGDPDAPDVQPPAPDGSLPALAAGIPQGPSDAQLATLRRRDGVPLQAKAGMLEWPAHVIHLPQVAAREADRLQLLGTRGELGDLDAHRLEPAARLTALFALADGREDANDEDWWLANECLRMSDAARADCLRQMKASTRRRKAQRAADDAIAKEQAEEQVRAEHLASAKRSILNWMTKNDPGHEGSKVGRFQSCTRYRDLFNEAIGELIEEGKVDRLGPDGTLYALAPGVKWSSVK